MILELFTQVQFSPPSRGKTLDPNVKQLVQIPSPIGSEAISLKGFGPTSFIFHGGVLRSRLSCASVVISRRFVLTPQSQFSRQIFRIKKSQAGVLVTKGQNNTSSRQKQPMLPLGMTLSLEQILRRLW